MLIKNLPQFKEKINIRDIFVCLDNVGCNYQFCFIKSVSLLFLYQNIHEISLCIYQLNILNLLAKTIDTYCGLRVIKLSPTRNASWKKLRA